MLKIKIDFASMFRKGIRNEKDDFLVALINGSQGSGKSYYSIYQAEVIYSKPLTIYTNIKSYKSLKNKVIYFDTIDELYFNHDTHCMFIIDELSKKYTKDSKIDKPFYSWLQQSRKHHRYVFLITQEYLQVPNWLRGVANISFTTKKIPLTSLMITTMGVPVLDKDTCEWGLNELAIRIYKRNKYIANMYNTYEIIDTL